MQMEGHEGNRHFTRLAGTYSSLFRVEEAVQQSQNGRLAASASAHDCKALKLWNSKRKAGWLKRDGHKRVPK